MYEVILFAAIATIICAMLYSVLGKPIGRMDDKADPLALLKGEEAELVPDQVDEPSEQTSLSGLVKIMETDKNFSRASFIDGAKGAYSMIIEAFAAGDRETLKTLITPDVYKVYAEAIGAREAKNLTQVTDLARLSSAEIIDAELSEQIALISVKYKAELSSALMDASGEVIEGDPDLLTNIAEVWIFQRYLKSKDPAWLLADVVSSEDELAADPTPDTLPPSDSTS